MPEGHTLHRLAELHGRRIAGQPVAVSSPQGRFAASAALVDGRVLYDVPDGQLPDPDMPAPARFLGEFDNALLGHDDRTRILAVEHRPDVLLKPVRPLLVDGMAAGLWTSGRTGWGCARSSRSPTRSPPR
jgi:hypothetical protein